VTPNKQQALVTVLIGLGVLIIGFFGLRTVHAFRDFHGHRPPRPFKNEHPQTDVQLIRDWMTLPYIAFTYQLPPRLLFETLNISPKGNEKKSLKQLNDEYFPKESGYVLKTVKTIVAANLPPPTATVIPTVSP